MPSCCPAGAQRGAHLRLSQHGARGVELSKLHHLQHHLPGGWQGGSGSGVQVPRVQEGGGQGDAAALGCPGGGGRRRGIRGRRTSRQSPGHARCSLPARSCHAARLHRLRLPCAWEPVSRHGGCPLQAPAPAGGQRMSGSRCGWGGGGAAHLLVQVLQLGSWQLQLGDLGQHHVPSPLVDVRHQRLHAVHGVEGHLALILRGARARCMGRDAPSRSCCTAPRAAGQCRAPPA